MGNHKYGVVLDAGSSGTRVYVYRWDDPSHARKYASASELRSIPEIRTKRKWTKKVKPGVSTFHDKPDAVGNDHLAPLFEHALQHIPKKERPSTPLFLLATAGMRLVKENERKRLLGEICSYARRHTEFLLPDCATHIQVIPGETEGLYGWIAANYLLGGFDDPKAHETHEHAKKGHHTYGFLDMGGASAQIAFAPNATESAKHADDLKLLRLRRLDGQNMDYRVFVTTWLGFGVNEARRRYVERLKEASAADGVLELPDPCLPKGLLRSLDGKEIEDPKEAKKSVHLLGTGKFAECERTTYPLLDKDKPCTNAPCLLNGQHVPAIDFDVNHFVGVSEYWHTTHEIFEDKHSTKAYDFATYQKRVKEFCEQDWNSIEKDVNAQKYGKSVDEDAAMDVCFKASWIINVLHDGIGIPRVGIEPTGKSSHNGTEEVIEAVKEKGFMDTFRPVDKIEDVEVSWTLGRMVLYVASQVPPAETKGVLALPVGFGNNVATANGVPPGFMYGGSGPPVHQPTLPAGNNYSTPADPHWHDALWREGDTAPRRIPGLLLFLLIAGLAGLLLIGRERRRKLLNICTSSVKGKRRRILGSAGTITYERVAQTGDGSPTFELGSFDEEEGWRVPKMHGGLYDGPGLGPYAGLGSAYGVETRDRLATRSREVSPSRSTARARSPLPPR
ncbi:nucleoside phosphatase family-domain-containing protein [Sphaerosporella brunnea]|uniref:Nucleoside phosphatase family-domain-containing protein n=1 Tax=Sphaerosporella brunnea TaxID=1250544 RepID=A0A5J5EGX2_9PEZI|nr:nucleoside phosphatase family-domain-containing protein [Sphaerosporella brunnea]